MKKFILVLSILSFSIQDLSLVSAGGNDPEKKKSSSINKKDAFGLLVVAAVSGGIYYVINRLYNKHLMLREMRDARVARDAKCADEVSEGTDYYLTMLESTGLESTSNGQQLFNLIRIFSQGQLGEIHRFTDDFENLAIEMIKYAVHNDCPCPDFVIDKAIMPLVERWVSVKGEREVYEFYKRFINQSRKEGKRKLWEKIDKILREHSGLAERCEIF